MTLYLPPRSTAAGQANLAVWLMKSQIETMYRFHPRGIPDQLNQVRYGFGTGELAGSDAAACSA
jgi:hypothetical protein